MHLSRRRFLYVAGAAGALPALSRRACAQAYPTRPLRWIVGFPPGGGADIVSRIMAPWLAERIGQPVVIENKPGASSNISVQTVATSPPDGYTLLFVPASAAVNVTLFDNLPFNLLRDIAPVSGLIDFPLVMVANPSLPAKTIAELIAYAKANPGKISIGSFGTGSTSHVSGELFKMMAGINMIHVPYRGGAPMVADVIGGQVQVAIDVLTGSLAHIRSGSLRALGMGGKNRSDILPDVPTIGETVAGYEANPDCLLFYRMGDFYELFFEDAELAARALGIVLTKRGKHLGRDIPMCGVPIHRSDEYLHRLIAQGHRVAVCEQLEDPAEAKKRGGRSVVRRDVIRVVTPGTLTEDTLLDAKRNNYLLAIARARGSAGEESRFALAWIDISTGEFRIAECDRAGLAADIARLEPGEIIVSDALYGDSALAPYLRSLPAVTPLARDVFDGATAER